jgi:fatty-acyl-CoA synthase
VAVVGLPHEKWGETPHAFVVLRPGVAAGEKEIHEFARANLAGFKTPKAYSFVTELPRTATGKIQKYVLRGKPAGGSPAGVSAQPPTRSDV